MAHASEKSVARAKAASTAQARTNQPVLNPSAGCGVRPRRARRLRVVRWRIRRRTHGHEARECRRGQHDANRMAKRQRQEQSHLKKPSRQPPQERFKTNDSPPDQCIGTQRPGILPDLADAAPAFRRHSIDRDYPKRRFREQMTCAIAARLPGALFGWDRRSRWHRPTR